jgi:hypothetical protein
LFGRTAQEAVETYRRTLVEALSCVTRSYLAAENYHQPETQSPLVLNRFEQVPLRGVAIAIRVAQHYMLSQNRQAARAAERWSVSTRQYSYALEVPGEAGTEILAFHWHPAFVEEPQGAPVETPHVHIGSAELRGGYLHRRLHVPTERVALEDVLTFVIRELGVTPLRSDWQEVFQRTRSQSKPALGGWQPLPL